MTSLKPGDEAQVFPEPSLEVLAAGVEWLYRTVQPDAAIQQHHGATIGYAATRYYGFCPVGALNLPVISVNATGWRWGAGNSIIGALTDAEMTATATALESLGVRIREQWNGDGCVTGSFGLTEPAHPSLLAAVANYRAHCPVHKSPFCGRAQNCTWYADGNRLIVGPERPGHDTEEG